MHEVGFVGKNLILGKKAVNTYKIGFFDFCQKSISLCYLFFTDALNDALWFFNHSVKTS